MIFPIVNRLVLSCVSGRGGVFARLLRPVCFLYYITFCPGLQGLTPGFLSVHEDFSFLLGLLRGARARPPGPLGAALPFPAAPLFPGASLLRPAVPLLFYRTCQSPAAPTTSRRASLLCRACNRPDPFFLLRFPRRHSLLRLPCAVVILRLLSLL